MTRPGQEYEKTVALSDGTVVLLRPELATDTEMLWDMFSTLSGESLRFLVLPFTRERIQKWTSDINYDRVLPVVTVLQRSKNKRIVAVASLEFNQASELRHKAEFGITVHDDYQNRGLGTMLTRFMLDIARRKGLKKVSLKVLTENKRAIRVYGKCGFWVEAKLEKENSIDGKYCDDYIMSIFL